MYAFATLHRLTYIHNMSKSEILNIDILHEDKDFVVINKPAGIMVHSDGKSTGPFITDWIKNTFPKAVGIGEPARDEEGNDIDRSGIVHRLDRDTSGALIIAKTKKGFEFFKKHFQERDIKKKYLALVWGAMKDDFGTITKPIGRSSGDFRKWIAGRGTRGELREAETYWTLNKIYELDNGEKVSLISVEPKTGRTHQIRVHMLSIQRPVVGDMLYAPNKPYLAGFNRMALHASELNFEDLKGKLIKVSAPLPQDFEDLLKKLTGN
jgi:23S rRNA pseudouridine1911/1915/1917 synthase